MYDAIRRGETLELFIYGDIGYTPWADGLMSGTVAKDISNNDDATQIDVRINSPGGDVFEGIAIFEALQRSAANVTTHIDGLAASIASIIAIGGDEVAIGPASLVMIHDPWTFVPGAAGDSASLVEYIQEVEQMRGRLDKIAGVMADAYASQTNMDRATASAAMTAETWYDADEAISLGFASRKSEEPSALIAAAAFAPNRFKNAPACIVGGNQKEWDAKAKAMAKSRKPARHPAAARLTRSLLLSGRLDG